MNADTRTSDADSLRRDADPAAAAQPQATGLLGSLARRPKLTLTLLTLACLVPFCGKAVNIDDPLFIWTAQQITKHPLDPYGFTAFWWNRPTPMWHIQQNPPLASYYMALIGSLAGWSERALHLAFVIPAVAVILATYRLARRFTGKPWVAAVATLAAPGFLVSATTLMCDVSMLALWMLAVVFWVEGLDEPGKPLYLAIAGVLIGACALTKYFGVSLIPLLFVYSWYRRRSFRGWIAYLAIPIAMLGVYELWTAHLYGHGHIAEAASYQSSVRKSEGHSGRALVGLAFLGGCTLPALTFVPLLWTRRQVLWGAAASAAMAMMFWRGWVYLGTVYNQQRWLHTQRGWISLQMLFYLGGAVSILALTILDFRKRRNPESLLLLLWVFGTIFFAVVANWTVNARSLLPLVPAVAILVARRLDEQAFPRPELAFAIPLIVSGAIALWVAVADMAWADTARTAAHYVEQKSREDFNKPWFEGRWGFEYYMQQFGARALEPEADQCKFGDLVVIPRYNTSLFNFPLKITTPEFVDFPVHTRLATMNPDAGAGFYFSGWGPLPFVFGAVPPQTYAMARVLDNP